VPQNSLCRLLFREGTRCARSGNTATVLATVGAECVRPFPDLRSGKAIAPLLPFSPLDTLRDPDTRTDDPASASLNFFLFSYLATSRHRHRPFMSPFFFRTFPVDAVISLLSLTDPCVSGRIPKVVTRSLFSPTLLAGRSFRLL